MNEPEGAMAAAVGVHFSLLVSWATWATISFEHLPAALACLTVEALGIAAVQYTLASINTRETEARAASVVVSHLHGGSRLPYAFLQYHRAGENRCVTLKRSF